MNSPKIDRCRTAFKLPADGRHTHPKRFLPAVPLNHQVHTSEKLRTSLALTSSSHHALAGTETALVNRQCPAIKHPQQPARNRVSCLLCRPAGELTQIAALAAVTHAPAAPADTKKYLRFADKQGRKEFSDTTHVLKGDYVLNRRPTNEKLSLKSVTSSPHATLLKSSLSGSITNLILAIAPLRRRANSSTNALPASITQRQHRHAQGLPSEGELVFIVGKTLRNSTRASKGLTPLARWTLGRHRTPLRKLENQAQRRGHPKTEYDCPAIVSYASQSSRSHRAM